MRVRAILMGLAVAVSAAIAQGQAPATDAGGELQARFQKVHLLETIPGAMDTRLTFSPDSGKVIYCKQGFSNSYPAVWDVKAGAVQSEQKKIDGCGDYSFAGDGGITAIDFYSNKVGMNWMETHELASGKQISKQKVPGERYWYSPEDHFELVSVHGKLAVWDLSSSSMVREMDIPSAGEIVRMIPGTKLVLTYEPGAGSILVWDFESGKSLQPLPAEGRLLGWCASRDGRLLATSYPGMVRIWDIASGRVVQTLKTGEPRIFWLAFSPDGRVLASADGEGTLGFWDVEGGGEVGSVPAATYEAFLVFSPDGRLLAAAGPKGSKSVRVWEIPGR